MLIEYKEFGTEEIGRVKEIYGAEGWTAYLKDDEALISAYENSLFCFGAYHEGKLIGLIRCVGDGEHIVLVQDLIVMPEFQGRKIGTALFKTAWEKYSKVRMFQVNTDLEDERDNRFYKSFGMRPVADGSMISYYR